MPVPLLQFKGQVVYAREQEEIAQACEALIRAADALEGRRSLVLGFDMEWQFHPQEKPPALIQLCLRSPQPQQQSQPATTPTNSNHKKRKLQPSASTEASSQPQPPAPSESLFTCYLLHICMLGKDRAHPKLKALLQHPKVFLATMGDRDEEKLTQELGIQPANLEQCNMAHFLLGRERKLAEEKQRTEQQDSQQQDPSSTVKMSKKMRRRLRQKEHNVLEQQPPTKPARREVVGLQNLVYMYLGMRLDKSCQLANDGWERQLDERCTMYAATDAYATLLVFEEIRRQLRPLLLSS